MWYFVHQNKLHFTISQNLLTLLLFNRLNALECGDMFLIKIFILIKDLLTFNAPYLKCAEILAFICPSVIIISFIHYTIYY